MELIRPTEIFVASYAEAILEDDLYREDNDNRHFRDPETVVDRSAKYEHGIGLPEGYVPATTFWLIDQDHFIGEIGIRHELTPALRKYGGHIGYEIRWSETRKGYGTQMLRMALPYCREELHLEKVLITCDDDNIGSRKIIENNGGILEDKIINQLDRGTILTRRYWIPLFSKIHEPSLPTLK